ncbi:TPA: hypothetical protein NJ448_002516 [Vibrio parahaemolyticus]|uniref:Type II secretion system protein D n=2 Tax=Vibrio parahaemolyticus TaxID=670 RepID=A0A7M1WS40_VIBPH|nr:secretin N-terminal domain-containing protein [Vibrio parahaemolyticus]MBE3930258.1 hypothetical protein [Vibrio parahaemolyticus]MBE4041725.1 hypothetical protein [Vibrio parahaemolyticus]MBE4054963.1 hypothetical protein [Vibrio parahaemolyticus]MBE4093562.1 hypothetical protein [Vibrio parahaemolyticus]MBE4110296.1 hypothetical protein [Vibrio parahaemolyticus]
MKSLHKSLILGSATVMLAGCMTTGTENVSADTYKDFDLGPSSLQNKEGLSADETNLNPENDKKPKQRTSVVKMSSLGSLGDADLSYVSSMPTFADSDKKISVAIDEMTIVNFIHHIFGDVLGLDYAIAPDVERKREKVVLRLQQEVTQEELYKLAANLLEGNKISVVSKDNILYFQTLDPKIKGNRAVGIGRLTQDVPNVSGDIVQLIPYTYNSANTIQRIATRLTDAKINVFDEQKLVVAEGPRAEIMRTIQLIDMVDVPSAKGRDIRFISMAYTNTGEMIDLLKEVLQEEGLRVGQNNADVAIVPVARQNSIIVYSTSATIGDRVSKWAQTLDKPAAGDKPRYYIFRPKYSKVDNLYSALGAFVTTSGPKPSSRNNGGGSEENASSAQAGAVSNPKGRVASKVSGLGSLNDSNIQISVDEVQNSLLIKATPQEYFELKELITRLDKLPPQVALDVAIAEFDISDNFTAGISKFLFDSNLNEKEGSVVTIQPTKGSISFSGVFDSMTIDMSLIEEKSKSRVLSRPYLVVQDGESASITAGKQVPVQTGSTTTDGGTTTTEIQYRSTGVTLNVTPTINADGVVSLDIAQSVTGSEPGPAELNPIITDRSLKTSVMVGDGQTAILGGLIQNNDSNKGNAVPFLSDIPGLGNLFKAKADTFSRSELVIMITPKIMTSTLDLEEFSDSLRDVFTMKVGQETPQTQVLEITETP